MKPSNQFQYTRSQHLQQVSVLRAKMNDFSYGKHAHEEYSFGVTLAGRQDFFAKGVFHRNLPGKVIIFNPDEVHDGHSGVDDALEYKMIYIHPDQLEPMLSCVGLKQFHLKETLLDNTPLRQHLLNLAQLVDNSADSLLQQECELYQIAMSLAASKGVGIEKKQRRADTLLIRARDFIHDNIEKTVTLDEISQYAHLSKYHFLRMFREHFGLTPHQYILNCRLNLARKDLENGISLDDLVFKYGFSDLSHFNRRFKPTFGVTPKQYQQLFLSD